LQSCYDVDKEIILSDYDKAIKLNPNYIDTLRNRMYLHEQIGEYEKVIENCIKLIEPEPTWENYDLTLGI